MLARLVIHRCKYCRYLGASCYLIKRSGRWFHAAPWLAPNGVGFTGARHVSGLGKSCAFTFRRFVFN
ncbi:hypothetical protein L1987_70405 [Smallanthus sonchifolius]|uniref:Uncharacterized protein n=1 Tax=Smallanthus sonchifolius TaxID=185202 RepID=A0ACB9AQ32_9ASTR|nr:hypothetical protein L1987_70405 [Smallanthus sonchifolius]